MSYNELNIPLSDDYKSSMVKAVTEGNGKDIQEFLMEYDLETQNGLHFLKWDFTNTKLVRKLGDDKFQCIKVKRGPWKFLLVYDKETKFLYSLMNEKRFNQVQERTHRSQVHYLDALALLNKGLKAINKETYKQLTLFDIDNAAWESEAEEVLHNILQCIDGEVSNYVLIAFTTNKFEISSVTAYIPTEELEIAYMESWNELIIPEFDIPHIIADDISEEDDEEIEIGLKDGVVASHNDVNFGLRRNEEKEEENK